MQGALDWFKVTLLFPLRDNKGNPFDKSVWDWQTNEITRLLRGFTDRGVVEGYWQGQTESNRSIVVIVKTEDEIAVIRNFLREARIKFGQRVMYLDYHPVHYEEVT